MNKDKGEGALKAMGLFLMNNLIAIIFILGLAFIVFAVFMWSIIFGFITTGVALILIALILNNEQPE